MLSQRSEAVLRIIISEYIATAVPVSSEVIAYRYSLNVSPATVRNEMAHLEEEGYIVRPHVSAGGVPSDKGYRHYMESVIIDGESLSEDDQRSIRELFDQVRQEFNEWLRVVTAVMSHRLRGIALATVPQANECHFRRIELVALEKYLVLLVLILRGSRFRQHLLTFEHVVSQEDLAVIAQRFNVAYEGLTFPEIVDHRATLSEAEGQIRDGITELMRAEDQEWSGELYLDGLRHLLAQPEFNDVNKMAALVGAMEEKRLLRNLVGKLSDDPEVEVKVTIGRENVDEVLKDCTVIIRSYGVPGKMIGAVGLIGPTRMPYNRVIPTVRYLSSVMSELTQKTYV